MNTTLSNNVSLRHHRCLLGPAWRYELAQSSRPRVPSQVAGAIDPWVRALANCLALQARGAKDAAHEKFPTVADAMVSQGNSELTAKLKLMVLAGMGVDEMHERLTVPVATLQAWEAIFFDVRDLHEATGWLAAFVIEREQKAGNTALASRMRLAISGGVAAVRTLLDSDEVIPLDEAERIFQRKLKLDLKFNEALDQPIDSERARLCFISMYTEMHLETKRLELSTRRLEERCLQAREQHELAKLRAELALQRGEQRAAQRQRAAEIRQHRQDAKYRRHSQAQDLGEYRQGAEQMALDARIAASPLAQFTWGPVTASPSAATTESASHAQAQEFEPAKSFAGDQHELQQVCVPEITDDFLELAAQHVVCTYDQAQLACLE